MFDCDWSSDVCSSDLRRAAWCGVAPGNTPDGAGRHAFDGCSSKRDFRERRSEERRVGKEGRSRGSLDHQEKKIVVTVLSNTNIETHNCEDATPELPTH